MMLFMLVLAIAVLLGWHYYLWVRLIRDVQPPDRWRKAGAILIDVLGVVFLFAMIAGRFIPIEVLRPVFMVGYGWLGMSFMLFMLFLAIDIGRFCVWVVRRLARMEPVNPERRRTLARLTAGVVAAIGFAGTATGVASALGMPKLERVRVPLRRLSKAMSGTRIVQLSDVHVGPIIRRSWVEEIVAQVQALDPDLVVITGDLVDGTVEHLREHVAPIGGLRAKYGVYFVTGNHEFFGETEQWDAELERIGVRVLRNEHVLIGEGDDAFCLANVDD